MPVLRDEAVIACELDRRREQFQELDAVAYVGRGRSSVDLPDFTPDGNLASAVFPVTLRLIVRLDEDASADAMHRYNMFLSELPNYEESKTPLRRSGASSEPYTGSKPVVEVSRKISQDGLNQVAEQLNC